jgi:hypothetical protein
MIAHVARKLLNELAHSTPQSQRGRRTWKSSLRECTMACVWLGTADVSTL